MASSAIGSYRALVLSVTTLPIIGSMLSNILFSSLVSLPPLIGSLPYLAAKSLFSFFIACKSITSKAIDLSCSDVNCLASLTLDSVVVSFAFETNLPLTPSLAAFI